jgi:predicted nucleic acid-binding protein
MSAFTFDTGVLIALEQRHQRAVRILELARRDAVTLVVPSACVVEWWRGRTDVRERILAAMLVEHTDDELVKNAGEALARVRGAATIDAIVMASAARRGGTVFTSDPDDLLRLQTVFPSVRVLGV